MKTVIGLAMLVTFLSLGCGGGGSGGQPETTVVSGDSENSGAPPLPSGALIPDFGSGGVVVSAPTLHPDALLAVATDADSMYLVGSDFMGNEEHLRIEKRRLLDGSLVAPFGDGGVLAVNPDSYPTYDWIARAVAVDAGVLFVAADNGYNSAVIEKRRANDGMLLGEIFLGLSTVDAMVLDSSAVYVCGRAGSYQYIEKHDRDSGLPIPGFGTNGRVATYRNSWSSRLRCMAFDGGNLYCAGGEYLSYNQAWRVEKLDASTGAHDSAFGDGGVVRSNPSGEWDDLTSIAVDTDSVFLGGYDRAEGTAQWRIEKRDKVHGDPVADFGTGGAVTVHASSGDEVLLSLLLDSDRLYAAGWDSAQSDGLKHWRVEKRDAATGNRIGDFGASGVVQADAVGGAYGLALDASGLILVGIEVGFGSKENLLYELENRPGYGDWWTNYDWHIEKRVK